MHYCPRCKVGFDSGKYIRCVYCEGVLVVKDLFKIDSQKHFEIKDREILTHDRKSYLLGSFFRSKTFLTSFMFSINDMKKGRFCNRFWVQPVNMSYVFKFPWVLINFIYSISFHALFKGYCEKCDMKYVALSSGLGHSEEDCEYNQEYNNIADEIFAGKLLISVKALEEVSLRKQQQGKKSAYSHLMNRSMAWEKFLDVMVILTSMAWYIYLITLLAMPIFGNIYEF